MSLLADPGFELGGVGSYLGQATRVSTQANEGLWSLRLRHVLGIVSESVGSWTSESIPAMPDELFTLRLFAFVQLSDALANLSNLRIEVDTGSGVFGPLAQLDRFDHDAGWVQSAELSFQAIGSYVKIRVRTGATGGAGIATADWYVDTIDLLEVTDVAVLLAYRAVTRLATVLQTHLDTALTAIETEIGGGMSLDAPASGDYHLRRRDGVTAGPTQVDIWDGDFEIEDPYTNALQAPGISRAVVPVTVRLTRFQRQGELPDTMAHMRRLYAAGLQRTLLSHSTIDATDPLVQSVVLRGIQSTQDEDASTSPRKITVTASVDVALYETNN